MPSDRAIQIQQEFIRLQRVLEELSQEYARRETARRAGSEKDFNFDPWSDVVLPASVSQPDEGSEPSEVSSSRHSSQADLTEVGGSSSDLRQGASASQLTPQASSSQLTAYPSVDSLAEPLPDQSSGKSIGESIPAGGSTRAKKPLEPSLKDLIEQLRKGNKPFLEYLKNQKDAETQATAISAKAESVSSPATPSGKGLLQRGRKAFSDAVAKMAKTDDEKSVEAIQGMLNALDDRFSKKPRGLLDRWTKSIKMDFPF